MEQFLKQRSPGRRRQDQFLDLYNLISGDIHIPTMLKKIAAVVCQEMKCQKTTVYMVQPATHELQSVNTFGNVLQMIRVPIREDSLAGFCALTRRSFIVDDAYGDLSCIDPRIRFDQSWDQRLGFRTRDVMCVPAVFQDELQGVIQVINNVERPFVEHDIEPLKVLARMIAYLIYNARMYDELKTMKELEKQKADFIRIMVHELKSPVSSAKMLLDSLPYLEEGDPRRGDLPQRMGVRLDQLLGIIDDILSLSRVKSGRPLGEVKVLNIAGEIRAAVDQYREQAAGKGLAMDVDIREENVPVRIDTQGFTLIMSNLVSNAIKYTDKGSVGISMALADTSAQITVRDTGMGVPDADKEKMFGEFFRAANARKSRINGTGVGLSGVKELVERFYGHIEFESEEGKGSAFTVSLPLYRE